MLRRRSDEDEIRLPADRHRPGRLPLGLGRHGAGRDDTLVTGVPGSGKSTLLAAGTRRLLESGAGRIQSYEAPIEFVFDGSLGDIDDLGTWLEALPHE